ncbi:orotate phosphoribosyltransferase [Salimicrobium halophilum]|uniref:Orotate phosphoribosyltransferase n=1 Tax=Salimicrobium halophilum TaxID=86666 RepID=A0A1G8QEE3_9BACI|nr:orotate phosphoribosyltransferase [Salimicrobium halophilum]SDJ03077.1 orotate phosphoribosyltransferase [Salimicrobium halophilum]
MNLAKRLSDIGAIQINTKNLFTWTSGIKSPIYCDNRLTISYPDVRTLVGKQLSEKIRQLPEKVDFIAGCATAGIPHAAWVADELQLPMVYIRGSKKSHGKENRIEGVAGEGQKAVVIEDLISTGGSSIEAGKVLEDAGVKVEKVLSIFTYELAQAADAFEEAGFAFDSLLTYSELMETLDLKEEEKEVLKKWRKDMNENR